MIRKTLFLISTVLALLVLFLWWDSYQTRKPRSLTPKQEAILRHAVIDIFPNPKDKLGIRWSHRFKNRFIVRFRTCEGSLSLRLDSGITTGSPIVRRERTWRGFGFKQWMWRSSTTWGNDGQPDIHDDYRVREARTPFWFLVTALAFYPTFVLLFRPSRRSRRRKLGLCLKCGYDLRGSEERCPECGGGFVS